MPVTGVQTCALPILLGVSLRIDFILYDRAMEATSYRTLRDRVSDHRMVVTALRRHPARGQDAR